MESSSSSSCELNFTFAFNDVHYSDKLLRIEIIPDPVCASSQPKSDHYSDRVRRHRKRKGRRNFIINSARHRKRKLQKVLKGNQPDMDDGKRKRRQNFIINSARHRKRKRQNVLNGNQPDMDDGQRKRRQNFIINSARHRKRKRQKVLNGNKPDDETCVIPSSGDEVANISDSNCSAATVVRVKTLHISSPILAAKSPFFFKLFSNGMSETKQRHKTKQRHISLRIYASEETAFMELLQFMYSNTLNITTAPALLDVLMAAEKFEVSSCMRYLINSPMTPYSASLYLELPRTVDAVLPLIDAAKQYLVGRYKNITMESFQEELMALPLSGIVEILASDDLQVESEDIVYDFALNWVRQKYKCQEERRKVIHTELALLIRYPYMTRQKRKDLIIDFEKEGVFKLLLQKLENHFCILSAGKHFPLNRCCVPRAYKGVMHMSLTREDWVTMFPTGNLFSEAFPFGGRMFVLLASCSEAKHDSSDGFGLAVGMRKGCKGGSIDADFELAVMLRPTKKFATMYTSNFTFSPGNLWGSQHLFNVPWTSFIAEDSPFFIGGSLHLRAELTISRADN
ncbi:BTB/POZ domain-containing protein POB1-like [Lotus japonicus]|uniref:BTB/POZ domain-containing protein POB1-like n=1 Tax=Lotus japonicus TaxID=34305 RepID=UPI00258B580F|nr:BTB/POZ domain-containing protein POB1-like [Lotus japonicus]